MQVGDPVQELEREPDAGMHGDAVRADVIERTFQSLLEDAERCEGELARADINRAYFRRNLTIPECGEVERLLRQQTINIVEKDEDDEDADDEPPKINSIALPARPYLSEAEEIDCGRKIQFANRLASELGAVDPAFARRVHFEADKARTRFVETNLRYVWKLAGQHAKGQHLTREDLFQEGMIGLLHATDLFDTELGFRFKTYATWWVLQTIHRAKANGERTVRLPVHLATTLNRIRRARTRLERELGRPATVDELAALLGLRREVLAKLLWRIHVTNCAEGDAPIGDDTALLDIRPDDEAGSAFDLVADRELHEVMQKLLLQLSPREERVIRMRFGFDNDRDHTLEMVGEQFGVTRERIRQIEAKALRKLMNPYRMRMLRSFVEI